MNFNYCTIQSDQGGRPYVADMGQMAGRNFNFRTAIWTGTHLQMTLMCIPVCGDIGLECHEDVDQCIRLEDGTALVKMGKCKHQLDYQRNIGKGDVVFVPAGIWHNIINTGRSTLKISSVYGPPNHPKGTIHHTKADAEREEY